MTRLRLRRRPKYVAFGEILDVFAHELGILAAHLREHDMKEGDAQRAASIEECVALIGQFRAYGWRPVPDNPAEAWELSAWLDQWDREEDKAWRAIWDHLRDHARGWWC